jgi:DNA-binding response OmpR family regulator
MKILIVEDEEDLLTSILNYFQGGPFDCDFALHVKDARMKMTTNQYDCFIIDIGLPDGSGLDLIKDIKIQPHQPGSIIISAKNSTDNKVEGLNLGADDYLTKPFELSELNARINSFLRRYKPLEKKEIVFNEIKINTDSFQVFINGVEIFLNKKEYQLLIYFISNQNKVIPKHAFVEHLWGNFESEESFDFLYAQIKNLRKKLAAGGGKDYIHTISRIGYRFREP